MIEATLALSREIDAFERRRAKLGEQLGRAQSDLDAALAARRVRMVEEDRDDHLDARELISGLRDGVEAMSLATLTAGLRIVVPSSKPSATRLRVRVKP